MAAMEIEQRLLANEDQKKQIAELGEKLLLQNTHFPNPVPHIIITLYTSPWKMNEDDTRWLLGVLGDKVEKEVVENALLYAKKSSPMRINKLQEEKQIIYERVKRNIERLLCNSNVPISSVLVNMNSVRQDLDLEELDKIIGELNWRKVRMKGIEVPMYVSNSAPNSERVEEWKDKEEEQNVQYQPPKIIRTEIIPRAHNHKPLPNCDGQKPSSIYDDYLNRDYSTDEEPVFDINETEPLCERKNLYISSQPEIIRFTVRKHGGMKIHKYN